jgi:signal peptidase I
MLKKEESASSTPPRWKGLLATFLLPGAGQFLQGRRLFAGIFLLIYLLSTPLGCILFTIPFVPAWLPLLLVPLFWIVFIWMLCDAFRPTPKIGWKRWLFIILLGVSLPLFELQCLLLFFRIYSVPNAAMSPTIQKGDYIFCLRAAYWHNSPEHGDIIAFSTKDIPVLTARLNGREETYLKRVVGLPGDILLIKNNSIFVNGAPFTYTAQQEPYLSISDSSYLRYDDDEYVVPKGMYFALGDNTKASYDSRFFGPIPISSIRGKVEVIVWPFSQISRLPATH